MEKFETQKIIIENGPAGTFKISEHGTIDGKGPFELRSQLRGTEEAAEELARTLAVMHKLNAIHDATR